MPKFEPHDWRIRLFFAGAINWMVIRVLSELYWNSNLNFLPFVALSISPVLLSILLTTPLPEKQIIPASYIQSITLSWLLITYFLWNTTEFIFLIFALFYSIIIFHILRAEIYFLGREGRKEDIKVVSLMANCEPETLISILKEDYQVRSCVGIDRSFFKDEREIFTRNGTITQLFAEIEPLEDDKAKCRLNIIIFKQGHYSILESEYFQELVERDIPYLKTLLGRHKPNSVTLVEDTVQSQTLRDFIYDRKVLSVTDRLSKLTNESWIKIILLLTSFAIPAYVWLGMNDIKDALIAFSVIPITLVLTSAQELFRSTQRRRK